ncbi:uncharacterized protein LOC116254565 [Nymphaea colorata]|nr:uncharacterized protein LOC116254565 [Nymphaea colorata]
MNADSAMAWVKRAGEAALHLLQKTFQLLVFLLRCLSPDLAVDCLPLRAGENEPSRDKEVATYASWSKLNIVLSFAGGLSLASLPSSLIHEKWTSFATYAIAIFVGFLLAMAVYSTCSFLRKTVMRVLLSISSAIISVVFAALLTVVLVKGVWEANWLEQVLGYDSSTDSFQELIMFLHSHACLESDEPLLVLFCQAFLHLRHQSRRNGISLF